MIQDFEDSDEFQQTDGKTRIVVKHLPNQLTEDGVNHLFSRIGKPKRVHVRKPLSGPMKSSTLTGLIIYESVTTAEKSIQFFDGFKIGKDGPALRVYFSLTPEEKQEMKKNKAMEEKLLDEIRRMPGFESLVEPTFAMKDASGDQQDKKGEGTSGANGACGVEEETLLNNQMYIVNPDGSNEIIVLEKDVNLTQLALELNLFHVCRKCQKECTYMCCNSASYCSLACQKSDRGEHESQCGFTAGDTQG